MSRGSAIAAALLVAAFLAAGTLGEENETAPPAPQAEERERVEEPGMGQREKFRERMRILRETGGEDDFTGFEDEALEEAARRRDEAIRDAAENQDPDELDPIEAEMLQDSVNEEGLWGGTGCFARPPDLSHQHDLALYKKLEKEDFLENRPDRTRAPRERASRLHAYVYVMISCALNTRVERPRDDHFVARARKAAYFPILSRSRSWWNPNSNKEPAEVLGHVQLHLELARLVSESLTAQFDQGLVAVRGEGPSEETAVARFQVRWGKHIQEARDELHRLERSYDRETAFGNDAARQAAWSRRIGEGLAAVRAATTPTAAE
jgi:hypothetical protein